MSRAIQVGGLTLGGGAPVVIQSMTNTPTEDVKATVAQIHALEAAGCELVRVAVPGREAAFAIEKIRREIHIPLVADIHFDHRLALWAVEAGADKIRINPGNIGGEERVREVARACLAHRVPIRIGVNGGSLEKALLARYGGVTAEAMVASAQGQIRLLNRFDFDDICISLKASHTPLMMQAYRRMADCADYPLHLGVTEAGLPRQGLLKSAVGIGGLLALGIGDTVRVTLTADPLAEIPAAKEILQAAGRRRFAPELIACPTCGRTRIDLIALAEEVDRRLAAVSRPLTVAVMGCAVNGPGEARQADVGIAGGDGEGLLFFRGEVVKKVPQETLVEELFALIARMEDEGAFP